MNRFLRISALMLVLWAGSAAAAQAYQIVMPISPTYLSPMHIDGGI